MKTDLEFHGQTHYLFRRNQVLSVEVREFLQLYDPRRLSPLQLRCLFSRISLEIEDAVHCGDFATIPEGRRLIQKLNTLWPWAGFFLDLTLPLGSAQTLGALPMLAYALCITDLALEARDSSGECTVQVNPEQYQRFRDQCFHAIDCLGQRAEIPPEVLAGRKAAVAEQLDRILNLPCTANAQTR